MNIKNILKPSWSKIILSILPVFFVILIYNFFFVPTDTGMVHHYPLPILRESCGLVYPPFPTDCDLGFRPINAIIDIVIIVFLYICTAFFVEFRRNKNKTNKNI